MNYVKSAISKEQYIKVQPMFGKFLCELAPVENEDGTLTVAQVLIDHEPDEVEFLKLESAYRSEEEELHKQGRIREIKAITGGLDDKLIEALERLIATNGVTNEDKAYAQERLALRDELGKLIQTEEGDGSDMNPYKWTEGKAVVTGKWYKTPSDYIWEAIKDGVPASEIDTEYFDVVGL